jgi:hypothetical protein
MTDCNILQERVLTDSADAAALQAWCRHADGCAACRRELALLNALGADARQTPTPGIGEERMAALRTAVAVGPEPMLIRSQLWLRVAAAVVLLAGTVFFLTRNQAPDMPIDLVEVQTPPGVVPPVDTPSPEPTAQPLLIPVAELQSSEFDIAAMDDEFDGLRKRMKDVRADDSWMSTRRNTYAPTLRRNDKFRQRMNRFRASLEEELG